MIILETGTENSNLQDDSDQTAEGVEPNTDAEATPQAEAEEVEVYFDEEHGDQKKPNMSQAQAYAAFKREKSKRKEKQKQIDAEKDRADALQRKLDELESQVGKIEKGAPPTLESCDFDEDAYQNKMREYYSTPASAPADKKDSEPAAHQNDEAQFYLFQKEQEILKVMPSYTESKDAVRKQLLDRDEIQDPDAALDFMSEMARLKGVDIAKAIVAIEKRPSIIDELLNAGNNQILAADIIKEAADKVKTRAKRAIDSQPEPEISNKGPIDHSAAKVEKLRQAWVQNSNARTYAAYKSAKDKLKGA